ncbi:uncharacterized protein EV420DRAFT_1476660 [Desarmillaria tabescens]|uniref:Uncharacterized protein n=1 Tax=Armillaria tabescens TaxID=1929756 RepID=A0AA39NC11_ARMTA|nr:uncharacterized protein EV420DRAFT_1476660 [Desarmillaria tabescens]KAK0462873.1 hypothetical protein EV420DRAFT_1476660 [Desarmillaria tabescens]
MNGLSYPTYPYPYHDGESQPYFPTPPPSASFAPPTYEAVTGVQTHYQQALTSGLQTPASSPTSTQSTPPAESSRRIPPPLGWSAPSRQLSRPCRCGHGRCRWRFFYPTRMMLAVHEVLPFQIQPQGPYTTIRPPRELSKSQMETFLVSLNGSEYSFLKAFASPLYRYCRDSAKRRRLFLQCEPWIDVDRIESGKVVCLGCGCDVSLGDVEYNPGNWMRHRDCVLSPQAHKLISETTVAWAFEDRFAPAWDGIHYALNGHEAAKSWKAPELFAPARMVLAWMVYLFFEA